MSESISERTFLRAPSSGNNMSGGGAPFSGNTDPMMGGGDQNAMGGGNDPMMGGGDQNAMGGGNDPMMGGGDQNAMGGGNDPMMGDDDQPDFDSMGGMDDDDPKGKIERLSGEIGAAVRKYYNEEGGVDDGNLPLLKTAVNTILGAVELEDEEKHELKRSISKVLDGNGGEGRDDDDSDFENDETDDMDDTDDMGNDGQMMGGNDDLGMGSDDPMMGGGMDNTQQNMMEAINSIVREMVRPAEKPKKKASAEIKSPQGNYTSDWAKPPKFKK